MTLAQWFLSIVRSLGLPKEELQHLGRLLLILQILMVSNLFLQISSTKQSEQRHGHSFNVNCCCFNLLILLVYNTVKDKICFTSRITSLIYLFSNNSQSVQTYLMFVPSACLANHSFSPLPFLRKSVGNTTCKLIFKMWFEGSLDKCDQSDYRKITIHFE